MLDPNTEAQKHRDPQRIWNASNHLKSIEDMTFKPSIWHKADLRF